MRYARHPGVLWRSTSAGPLLLPPHTDDLVHLTGAGAVVWELLDEPATEETLRDEACELIGGSVDITDALTRLCSSGLVLEA